MVELPRLEAYALEVQQHAGTEFDDLGPECPRTAVVPGCSALKTLVNDYLTLRRRIRCASGEPLPTDRCDGD